jgi:hypothetical protein
MVMPRPLVGELYLAISLTFYDFINIGGFPGGEQLGCLC